MIVSEFNKDNGYQPILMCAQTRGSLLDNFRFDTVFDGCVFTNRPADETDVKANNSVGNNYDEDASSG